MQKYPQKYAPLHHMKVARYLWTQGSHPLKFNPFCGHENLLWMLWYFQKKLPHQFLVRFRPYRLIALAIVEQSKITLFSAADPLFSEGDGSISSHLGKFWKNIASSCIFFPFSGSFLKVDAASKGDHSCMEIYRFSLMHINYLLFSLKKNGGKFSHIFVLRYVDHHLCAFKQSQI